LFLEVIDLINQTVSIFTLYVRYNESKYTVNILNINGLSENERN